MSKFPLDLSKFKKIKSDKKTTTFQHDDGHHLTVAHSRLAPKLKDQIERLPMAEGGEIKSLGQIINYPGSGPKPAPKPKPQMYKDGGDVFNPDENLIREQEPSPEFKSGIQIAENTSDAPSAAQFHPQPEQFNIGNMLPVSYLKQEAPESNNFTPPKEEPGKVWNGSDWVDRPGAGGDDWEVSSGRAPVATSEEGYKPGLAPSEFDAKPEDSTQAQTPAPVKSAHVQAQPQQQAPVRPQPSPQEVYAVTKDTTHKELSAENKAWEQDLNNGHIEPKTYQSLFADKGALGKIGTIFGLMLGGMGGGLTGQQNGLLQMMDKTIANDLEAQKQSKSNAQNFLRLNQQHEMNKAQIKHLGQEGQLNEAQAKMMNVETNTKAWALAQAKTMQTTFHDLVEQVGRMTEGPQKEAAKQQLGMIYSHMSEKINNLNDQAAGASAYYKALHIGDQGGGGQNNEQQFQNDNDAMRLMGPQGVERAKDREEKHFPGIDGKASVPLTHEDRTKIRDGMAFQKELDRFIDWTKKHSGSLNPADVNYGEALAASLNNAYRGATGGGVYKEGEAKFINKSIDDQPTKIFNSIRVIPKLLAVKADAAAQLDNHVKSLGFNGYQGGPGGQSEPQYKMSGGVKYMRGPNGQAIAVK